MEYRIEYYYWESEKGYGSVNRFYHWVRLMRFVDLQHPCQYCGVLFPSRTTMKRHMYYCVYCDVCEKFVEVRHLKDCKGKKEKKCETVMCNLCRKFRSKKNMGRHMLAEHGFSNWSARDHPQYITKVRKI